MLGSIPFGVILTRMFGAGDLRQIGSGNIGATNVLRTGRKGLAAGTLLLDIAKGSLAVFLAGLVSNDLAILAGVGAFLGHLYPIWLRFNGGKGVATMLGVVLALHWMIGLIYAFVWVLALAVSRISSVSGIAAAVSAPIAFLVLGWTYAAVVCGAMATLLVWKHRENMQRIVAGVEPRIGKKSA